MSKLKIVRVIKTDTLNQNKLTRISRKFGVSPLSVRELQLGYSEEIPERAANQLIKAGYVKRTKEKTRPHQERVDSITTTVDKTPVLTTDDDGDTLNIPVDAGIDSDPSDEREQV